MEQSTSAGYFLPDDGSLNGLRSLSIKLVRHI